MEDKSVIEVQGVSKTLGSKVVLDSLDLSVKKGEVFAIIGKSGAGKSVTLKIIARIMKPDKGVVKINDIDINKVSKAKLNNLRKKIGFLFQAGALLNSCNIFDNLALPLHEGTNLSDDQIKNRVSEALGLVSLSGIQDKMPEELSFGMRKRVGLARAIVTKPEIILYDEPTAGLDPVTGMVITNLISDLQRKIKTTSIVVTHDLVCVSKIATRVGLLDGGKIVEIDNWQNFIKSDTPLVREFLTSSKAAY